MASKKAFFRIKFSSPVTLAFTIVTFLVLVLDKFALKNFPLVQNLFSVPGALAKNMADAQKALGTAGMTVFNFSNPLHYLRLFLHVLGNGSWRGFLFSSAVILSLGPQMEERYGSASVALMLFVSAFVSGVLNACFLPQLMSGAVPFVLMLILLSSITSLSKNEIPLTTLLIFLVALSASFLGIESLNKISVLGIFAQLAGALAGSLAGFLTAPKARASASAKEKKDRLSEIDAGSPRRAARYDDDETTVIGSINI